MEPLFDACRMPVPKNKRVKGYRFAKVDKTTRVSGVVCNSEIWGFGTHWFEGRTQPHAKDKKLCQGCLKSRRLDWLGVLQLYSRETKGCAYIGITDNSAVDFLAALDGASMRGKIVMIARERPHQRAPLRIEILGVFETLEFVPKPVDPLPVLQRLWGVA
jgi:hypothetical protein